MVFGIDEIDSSFILTKAENENYFSPIPVFDFDEKFDITGEDLLITGLMITLGTDTERKFAWCLRKINNRPFICIHKRKDGYSKFNENDFITAFPIDVIEDCLKLLL